MCGRFTLSTPAEQLAYAEVPNLTPRYNVAPTQLVAVGLRPEAEQEVLGMVRPAGRGRALRSLPEP
jgi:putative SOS response-associated peptidase YedK